MKIENKTDSHDRQVYVCIFHELIFSFVRRRRKKTINNEQWHLFINRSIQVFRVFFSYKINFHEKKKKKLFFFEILIIICLINSELRSAEHNQTSNSTIDIHIHRVLGQNSVFQWEIACEHKTIMHVYFL